MEDDASETGGLADARVDVEGVVVAGEAEDEGLFGRGGVGYDVVWRTVSRDGFALRWTGDEFGVLLAGGFGAEVEGGGLCKGVIGRRRGY